MISDPCDPGNPPTPIVCGGCGLPGSHGPESSSLDNGISLTQGKHQSYRSALCGIGVKSLSLSGKFSRDVIALQSSLGEEESTGRCLGIGRTGWRRM